MSCRSKEEIRALADECTEILFKERSVEEHREIVNRLLFDIGYTTKRYRMMGFTYEEMDEFGRDHKPLAPRTWLREHRRR